MSERKCKLRGWSGIGGALDLICEVKKDIGSRYQKDKLQSAINSIKNACNITAKDGTIGLHYPWSKSTCE